MTVYIPSPLRSYTGNASQVQAAGASLGELLDELNVQFPGMRFRMIDEHGRIRPHIKLFINQQQAFHLDSPLRPTDEVHIICAISGGMEPVPAR